MKTSFFVLSLVLLGCSQTPSPAQDGGETDAVVEKDTGLSCSLPDYDGGTLGTGCGVIASFTCGQDVYEIDCSCPSAKCTCIKDGAIVGTTGYASQCPTCSQTSFDDGGCGFPVSVSGP